MVICSVKGMRAVAGTCSTQGCCLLAHRQASLPRPIRHTYTTVVCSGRGWVSYMLGCSGCTMPSLRLSRPGPDHWYIETAMRTLSAS